MNYTGMTIICPFYTGENKTNIYCEGVTNDNEAVKRFGGPIAKKNYLKNVCTKFDYSEKCKYARLLKRKYEREEKDNEQNI